MNEQFHLWAFERMFGRKPTAEELHKFSNPEPQPIRKCAGCDNAASMSFHLCPSCESDIYYNQTL